MEAAICMSFSEQRSLDELIERYTRHPEFCDIYVEGVTDRGLLGWFFVDVDRPEVTVYEIETVNIPPRIVREFGLENNNRGRVLTLTRFLHEQLGDGIEVIGVIDADLDY